jgi:hypothetical protein
MRTVKLHGIVAGLALAALALAAGPGYADQAQAHASGKSGRVTLPVVSITQGEKCVEPTDEMRRNHMKKIMHQRDRTMHDGIRTTQHSLKNCVNCHADPKTNSVLGKDGFCSSCHRYAAVTIDCFECHTDKRETAAGGVTPSVARALNAATTQNQAVPAKGKNP